MTTSEHHILPTHLTTTPPAGAVLCDPAPTRRSLADLQHAADEYRREGYAVLIAPLPLTGTLALWRVQGIRGTQDGAA